MMNNYAPGIALTMVLMMISLGCKMVMTQSPTMSDYALMNIATALWFITLKTK